jgi:hypothetical protein
MKNEANNELNVMDMNKIRLTQGVIDEIYSVQSCGVNKHSMENFDNSGIEDHLNYLNELSDFIIDKYVEEGCKDHEKMMLYLIHIRGLKSHFEALKA